MKLKIIQHFRITFPTKALHSMCGGYRKDGCLEISDFWKSTFWTFTIGEYQKHRFIKAGEKIHDIQEIHIFDLAPISPVHKQIIVKTQINKKDLLS